MGAGQLGRMLHQASISLGVELCFLAASDRDAAVQIAPNYRVGSAMEPAELEAFSDICSIVTFEHEVVDLESLAKLEAAGAVLRPSAAALGVVADKLAMRETVEAAGIPVPPWRSVESPQQTADALVGWPQAVVKLSRGGYDGRGVYFVDADASPSIPNTGAPLLIEPKLDIDVELAVIAVRAPTGDTVVYDPVATLQIDGQCRQVTAPAVVDGQVVAAARRLARRVAQVVEAVGVVAVELFLVGGELVVNELAVRPHNTGHHTIDACVTSQFENHLRAVLDLPLGETALTAPAAATVNIIAGRPAVDPRDHLTEALTVDPGARVHLYGKEPRPDRKIGHVTVCDETPTRAAQRAWQVVRALGGDIPDEEMLE